MSKIRHGLIFEDEVTDLSIELHCYRWGGTEHNQAFHLKRAWQIAFPEKLPDGRDGYIWSEWDDWSIECWCNNRWATWWGASATGKSTRAAILVLLHWMSAPDQTTIHLTSTTAKMLKLRIWGEVLKYYQLYGEGVFPGIYLVAENAIVYSKSNQKSGIFGHAVMAGPADKAVSNIVGVHNTFNVLVVDEMQGTSRVLAKAPTNLMVGKEFKFLGMGNPMSRLDFLGDWSEPLTGWDTVTPETGQWNTKRGVCLHFDGLKSPGVKDPERFSFLLKQREIDETIEHDGVNSPNYWTMRRGFVPPEGLMPTLMTESFIVQHKMMGSVTWRDGYEMGAGIDPAYSSKGDRAVFYPFRYGTDIEGRFRVCFMPPEIIPLNLNGETPIAYYLAAEINRIMSRLGMPDDHVAMDCTGVQGMLADICEQEHGLKIHRVYFGGKASTALMSESDNRRYAQTCKNRVTELWMTMSQFGKSDMIRGLTVDTVKELVQRLLVCNVSPMCLESKTEMKARTGESPDLADGAVIGLAFLRDQVGITPGDMEIQVLGRDGVLSVQEKDIDGWDDNFLCSAPL
jgi:hypothetical protein